MEELIIKDVFLEDKDSYIMHQEEYYQKHGKYFSCLLTKVFEEELWES